jgi:hypothetical protein
MGTMHHKLESLARQMLKDGLAKCDEKQQEIFKLMYGRARGKRSMDDAKAMDINALVDEMPEDKLSWALTQVERTVDKNETSGNVQA